MIQQVTPAPVWAAPIASFLDELAVARAPRPTITLRSYYLRRFAADHKRSPWEVTTRDLVEYLKERRDWSPSTVKSFRSTMREFYRWAVDAGLTIDDPAARLLTGGVRVPAGTPRPASDAAYETALEKADERTRLMLRLAAQCGLRCREIALVDSADVEHDLVGASLRVDGKGGRVRHVPCPEDLAVELLKHDGPVFPGQIDGHLSAAYVSKLLSRSLPGATGHQLRHRYATRAYRYGGRDLRAVQELLGHASVATTQIYTAVDLDDLRRAAAAAA